MITIQCRDHGGTFQVPPKRGRRPVRCNPQNVCTRGGSEPQASPAQVARAVSRVEATASAIKNARMADTAGRRRALEIANDPEVNARIVAEIANPALPAKARLEEQGWLCKGSGRTTDTTETLVFPNGRQMSGDNFRVVELTAVRDEEMITMVWVDGELIQQDYSLWSEKPSANAKPAGRLTFDPDECTDRELVRALAGCKVTWWNVLGQREEDAVIKHDTIKIEHAYSSHGDEMPGDRIVKFIDHNGEGYRAFRVAALLKVG
jgi:hypothetical protein